MKKLYLFIIFLILIFACAGCGNDINGQEEKYSITFKQENIADKVRYVSKGENLVDIPEVFEVAGYDVKWERTTFINIQSDVIVNAIITPKEYTITYDLMVEEGASLESNVQKVIYNQDYTLYIPTTTYKFVNWKIKDTNVIIENGKYTFTTDITLVPVWDTSFSPNK